MGRKDIYGAVEALQEGQATEVVEWSANAGLSVLEAADSQYAPGRAVRG